MEENMMDLYKQLNIDNKRNEFSSLLLKVDTLLNALLAQKELNNNTTVKNYDINAGSKFNEDETLTFFYEDLWSLKNKILLLMAEENK
jgi:hypothetical protein